MRDAAERVVTPVEEALISAAERLTVEFADLPAGSVLRCYTRAVLVVRRRRGRPGALPQDAETLARIWLSARRGPGGRP